MSTITKEWLQQKIAGMEATRDEIPFGLDEDDSNTLSALRIALASLEAEPVAYIIQDSDARSRGEKGILRYFANISDEDINEYEITVTPLYAAPPAPVSVPEKISSTNAPEVFEIAAEAERLGLRGAYASYAVGWNACRAAMLQGADGNSPDGWVACSERIPEIGTEIFYFCQGDGLRDCGIVSSSNFSGRGDAQLYVHAEGYDLRFGVDITHWMPLPAAP